MMRTLIQIGCALALLAVVALGQNGQLSVLHGLPGLSGPVDILVNGAPTFTSVNYGEEACANYAPGNYNIDFVINNNVVLSGNALVVDGERTTIAAHTTFGNATYSVFNDARTPVTVPGTGRIRFRHLSDASLTYWGTWSPSGIDITFMGPLQVLEAEAAAGDYQIEAEEVDLTNFVFPFPGAALSSGVLTLKADEDITINLIGTPDSPSFGFIVQVMSLDPSVVTPPAFTPDLSLSGSLVSGTIDVGGTITSNLTGAPPGAIVGVFLSSDNVPHSFMPGLTFGIGGLTGMFSIGYGTADANGNFSSDFFLPGISVSLVGLDVPVFVQAVAVDVSVNGPYPAYTSDVESFNLGI